MNNLFNLQMKVSEMLEHADKYTKTFDVHLKQYLKVIIHVF